MHKFSLRARWVLPVAGGVVSVQAGQIVGIDAPATSSLETIDLGDVVLMPGLVNAHTHLEFSDLPRPVGKPGMALPEWIRLVIGERNRSNRNPREAVAQGLVESLRSGVTTLGEIANLPLSVYADLPGPSRTIFQEVIGFSAARCDSVLSDLKSRLNSSNIRAAEHLVGISPHAPYTVHPNLLRQLVSLAQQRHIPLAMHLAESREELELLATGSGPFQELLDQRGMWDPGAISLGSTVLDYLRVLADAPRSLVIHGNYLSEAEIEFLGQRRDFMSVVYCPRTHAYFGHPPYPLEKLLKSGVRVALGTDSRASNPDLGLLGEMRFVAKRFPNLPPESILNMGTQWGAEALGLADQTGLLSVGQWADLVALACPAGVDPHEAILHGFEEPCRVFFRGEECEQVISGNNH